MRPSCFGGILVRCGPALFGAALASGASAGETGRFADIAYVEAVRGHVVAAAVEEAPFLLDLLDPIADRTRLDLQPNSELRLCHYRAGKILILHGPQRVTVAADRVIAETGAVEDSGKSCTQPVVSNLQGGFISRGIARSAAAVPLEPRIKIVNRGTRRIRNISLWDEDHRTKIETFEGRLLRPQLADRTSYLLVLELSHGNELNMTLHASAAEDQAPLFIVVQ